VRDVKPLVTVIIPAYNRAGYLNQAIDSVLNQTYEQVRLIVVDDGSTDGSYELIQAYGDRLTLLTHSDHVNKGQSASINLGLKQAFGHCEFIAILDSDDYWEPEKIVKQLKPMMSDSQIGLVYSNGWGVNATGNFLYDIYDDSHVEYSRPENVLLDCYFFVPTNSLVRECVFRKVGLQDETLRSAQDHDMAIRIAEECGLAYIPDQLFSYRRHENTISNKNAQLRWDNGFIILKKAAIRYKYDAAVLRKRSAVLHFRLFQIYKGKGEWGKAVYHIVNSGCRDPVRAMKVLLRRERVSSPH